MATIDNAYSYYMQTYGNSVMPRYETHKKSELRNVYNSIVKLNKESPLYKLDDLDESKRFAIDMKESAVSIQSVVNQISESESSEAFKQKVAVSSDKDVVSVKYISDEDTEAKSGGFEISVKELAKPQINIGNYLDNTGSILNPGEYTFDLSTNTTAYEFQLTVHAEDQNLGLENRIAKMINEANIKVRASVISNGNDQSALKLESSQTGLAANEESLFTVSDDNTYNSQLAMAAFGIDRVSQPASNSSFLLNGEERSSYSNTFTINKAFELHLSDVNEPGESVTIGFKADSDAIVDNVVTLVDSYNNMVDVAKNYFGESAESNKLYNMVSTISNRYKDELEPIGLNVMEDMKIEVNRMLLADSAEPENWSDTYSRLKDFTMSVSNLADKTALNPMDFVNKTVVAYKNPGHNFNAPYVTSVYAGMLYNQYK